MKRRPLISLLFLLSLLPMMLLPLFANALNAQIEGNVSTPLDVCVDHVVQILDGGLVFINDSIGISTKFGQSVDSLNSFLMGFPFKYGANLAYVTAYETLNPDENFAVIRDVILEKRGFYGINVTFPSPIDISGGKSYNFTVFSVFSNLITSTAENRFSVDFPLLPGLTQNASKCNVRIILPSDSDYVDSSFTYSYYRPVFSSTITPLEAFAYQTGWVVFERTVRFLLIDVEVNRDIKLNQPGRIFISDSYYITNKDTNALPRMDVQLLQEAYGVFAQDVSGIDLNIVKSTQQQVPNLLNYTVEFKTELATNETLGFTIFYGVPWATYITESGLSNFNFTFTLLEKFNWVVRTSKVKVTLPEGAEYVKIEPKLAKDSLSDIQKDAFGQSLTLTIQNITSFQDLSFSLTYTYLVFWASFRPTLWIGTLTALISVIAFLWQTPKLVVPILSIPSADLKGFVDLYKEKTNVLSELRLIEEQAYKGKIPRRRYKLRRTSMESRLSTINRDLTALREKIHNTDPRHASITRQMEIAETELQGAETDTRRAKLRYKKGEISASAYRKLIEDANRRKDRAKTTIDEVLLRLKEDIR